MSSENSTALTKEKSQSGNMVGTLSAVAGGSGGTLLVLLAQNLPATNQYKTWLVIIAPFASVLLNNFWVWAQQKWDVYISRKEKKRYLTEAKQTISEQLMFPSTSEERKKELRKQLEQVHQMEIDDAISMVRKNNIG